MEIGRRNDAAVGIHELETVQRREASGAPCRDDVDAEQRSVGRAEGQKALRGGEPVGDAQIGAEGLRDGELEEEGGPREGHLGLVEEDRLAEIELGNARSGAERYGLEIREEASGRPG